MLAPSLGLADDHLNVIGYDDGIPFVCAYVISPWSSCGAEMATSSRRACLRRRGANCWMVGHGVEQVPLWVLLLARVLVDELTFCLGSFQLGHVHACMCG